MENAGWYAAAVMLIGAIVKAYLELRDSHRAGTRKERQDTLDEYKDLLDHLRSDYDKVQAEVQGLRRENSILERRTERQAERITNLEDILRQVAERYPEAGIKFRPWVDQTGSDAHRPLPDSEGY